ncbi:unnamed protein product [Rotaria magnacalcarata]|uniref:Anoctamin n=1 Tax=Rotaria magnacalcarata TaxID=392030 RepID=A0A8S2LQ02_9BILA|nr:unnamed protein product [Rotaria magnacalcarata]
MRRVVPLPPIIPQYEMPIRDGTNLNDNTDTKNLRLKRRSFSLSLNSNIDSLPIDLILVYDRKYNEENDEVEDSNDNRTKRTKTPSERRKKFEEYLCKKQGLILKHVETHKKRFGFVKVHTPFDILLLTAENMRMKLPIEKIEENEDANEPSRPQATHSVWNRCVQWLKNSFYLDVSLKKNDPDYYTAIYSSNIDKFKDLFDTLRGSKDAYFTSTERSLLTHELLSRAHFDYDEDDDDDENQPVRAITLPITNTTAQPRTNSRRSGQETFMCPRCDKTCPFWKLSDSCLYSKVSYVFDNAATVIFAILMSLWARWFIEFWKRRQAILRYDWDSMGFEENLEPIRPEFEIKAKKKGEERVNPVTGIKEPYVSTRTRLPFFLVAASVVLFMMAIVCTTVFATIVYRSRMDFILKNTSAKSYSSIIITVTSAIMNLICSVVLSQFYYWVARKLTDLELHKYQSKYDDSLTIKIYLFQFVNFYSSLFYIAFFKGRFLDYPSKYNTSSSGSFTEQCDPAGCLVELSIQFIIIMIGKQIINNLIEFFYAMRRTLTRICFDRSEPEAQHQWEKDNELYDFTSNTLTDEYLELVIQFGFVTLFVAAFPLAPLFALFNNIIEIRLDAWKFLSKYKRPIPFKAFDIGIWSDIISGISYFAVLTNGVVIAWTSEFIPKMAYRSIESTGGSLNGYLNWTLSSFNISDYNLTGTMPQEVPANLTICRYRDFREPSGPHYSQTSMYWNVLAARLAFIIVFEHVIFFIIYLMDWLVPDVPQTIQNKINHERYIDQCERWASKTTEKNFKHAVIASEAIFKMVNPSSGKRKDPINEDENSTERSQNRKIQFRSQSSLDNG